MAATFVRRVSLVLAALLLSAATAPPADAGRIFGRHRGCHKRCAPRRCCPPVQCCRPYGGCLCVKFMYADLGETEIYYAHEHDDCSSEEQCLAFTEVWHSGQNLTTNQNCPDNNCIELRCLGRRPHRQPKLNAPKSERFNIYLPDPDVTLNPWLPKRPQGNRTGVFRHPDDGRPIYVKVFSMHVTSPSDADPNVCIGVEVERATNIQFDVPAVRMDGLDYVYLLDLGGDTPCLVIASQ